jgi:hypothetical protein
MNTKLLMTTSAIALGLIGVALTFFPAEIAGYARLSTGTGRATVVLQILGALYFSFAMVNWTARANLIGGIYARPISIGNLTHFTIAALALIKAYAATNDAMVLPFAIGYTIFAALFAVVFFRHPVK